MPSQVTEHTWPRPLLALTVVFVLALAIERMGVFPATDGIPPLVPATAAVLLATLWTLLWVKAAVRWAILPLLLFFLLGLLAHEVTAPRLSTIDSLEPFVDKPPALFVAEVMGAPDPQPEKTRFFLHLLGAHVSQGDVPLDTGAILTIGNCRQRWLPGQLLMARLPLKRIHGFHNPGGYDYERSQAERGFFVSAFLPDDRMLIPLSSAPPHLDALRRHRSSWPAVLARFRLNALDWLKTELPANTAAIYAALLLGFQNQVPRDIQEHWNRAGVTHLLSISGQHLGMVAMAAFWLFRCLFRLRPTLLERRSDQQWALWWAVALALLYAAVGGLSLPTWRSAIMLSLFFVGIAWGRPADFVSALSLAALLMLLGEPHSLWTASFQLTFAAVFGIFLVYPRLRPLRTGFWRVVQAATGADPHPAVRDQTVQAGVSRWRVLSTFADAFWVSLAANLMVLPLVIHHFHGISVVGFLANTVLVPLTGFLVLPLGLLSLALFAVNRTVANWVLVPGGWTVELSETLIEFFSRRSWAYHWVGDVGVFSLILMYGALGTILSSWRRRTKAIALAGLILVACFGTWRPAWVLPGQQQQIQAQWRRNQMEGRLQVMFIDVGQGSSTLLGCPDGSTILVDGGGYHDDAFDIGRNVVAPFLWYLGIKKVDAVVLSHDHPDHGYGLRFILSHFHVGSFCQTGIHDPSTPSPATILAEIAAQRGIPRKTLELLPTDGTLTAHGLSIRHPSPGYLASQWDQKNLNNVSMVIEALHGNTRLILPGDIDESVEQLLAGDLSRGGELLLAAPHHGSRHATSAALLDAVRPKGLVLSCGYGNRFGFPHESVLERLRDRGVETHRTDLEGAIWAVSDGHSWRLGRPDVQLQVSD
ncbi:MAG TPA: DNA internalization-related competence protein ComEC/Rec2 [Syntrophobacteraceae bacterium]|nr:DNA internalization-related competence protein ComEC/Rec2 [Syntrophobacteraceae bacterium]